MSGKRLSTAERLFLLLIAIMPVMQPLNLEFHRFTVPPADFVFLAAAVATAFDLLRRRVEWPSSDLVPALALYAIAVSLSAVASEDRAHSALKVCGTYYLIALPLLALIHLRSFDAMRRALTAWLIGTAVAVAAAFAGLVLFTAGATDWRTNIFLSIKGSLPEGSYPRVMGVFLNPNMFCAYLVASLAVLLAAERLGWIPRRTAATGAGTIAIAGVSSLSPGFGGLLLVGAFGAWAIWRDSHRALVRLAAAVAGAGAVFFLLSITVSPESGDLLHHPHASSRLMTWMAAIGTFRAHPVLGKGVGLEAVYVEYLHPSGLIEVLTDAHNAWLSLLALEGIVGFAAFVWVVRVLLRGTWPVRLETARGALVGCLMAGFAGGFLYQSLSGSFESTRHVWLLIGLLAAAKRLPADVTPASER